MAEFDAQINSRGLPLCNMYAYTYTAVGHFLPCNTHTSSVRICQMTKQCTRSPAHSDTHAVLVKHHAGWDLQVMERVIVTACPGSRVTL